MSFAAHELPGLNDGRAMGIRTAAGARGQTRQGRRTLRAEICGTTRLTTVDSGPDNAARARITPRTPL